MAILTYKCNIAKEKRPKWLRCIISGLYNAERRTYNGNASEYQSIKKDIDKLVDNINTGGTMRSKIRTELREDNGETVLFVKRNGTPVLSIYIK